MHLLDIAQNSITAGASFVDIKFTINEESNELVFTVLDNGRGMDEKTLKDIKSPFYTSRTTRKVGLGIPMLINTAQTSGGYVELSSQIGAGTKIKAVFGLDNVDRPPLGDLAGSMLTLIYASESTDIKFYYNKVGGEDFAIDTRELRKALDGIALSEPSVMSFVRDYIYEGIKLVNNGGVL